MDRLVACQVCLVLNQYRADDLPAYEQRSAYRLAGACEQTVHGKRGSATQSRYAVAPVAPPGSFEVRLLKGAG